MWAWKLTAWPQSLAYRWWTCATTGLNMESVTTEKKGWMAPSNCLYINSYIQHIFESSPYFPLPTQYYVKEFFLLACICINMLNFLLTWMSRTEAWLEMVFMCYSKHTTFRVSYSKGHWAEFCRVLQSSTDWWWSRGTTHAVRKVPSLGRCYALSSESPLISIALKFPYLQNFYHIKGVLLFCFVVFFSVWLVKHL